MQKLCISMFKFCVTMKKVGLQRALRWPVGIEQILPVFFQKPAKHLHKTLSYKKQKLLPKYHHTKLNHMIQRNFRKTNETYFRLQKILKPKAVSWTSPWTPDPNDRPIKRSG